MPVSPSLPEDPEDRTEPAFARNELYDTESLDFHELTPAQAAKAVKRMGAGGVVKHESVEGMGWKARRAAGSGGVVGDVVVPHGWRGVP